jgi:ketosteroid isomerase-like protein
MKYIFVLATLVFLFQSCSIKNTNTSRDDLKDTLMNIDREFSKISESGNTSEAFIKYSADEVILMRQGEMPIVGGVTLKDFYSEKKNKGVLKWEPLKADVSGDIGYTMGRWELGGKTPEGLETTIYGVYSTVWKRQADGSWKYVIDCGNVTPSKFELNK